ncbi:MAG: alpha/beta fold hydrolase [Clostridia bacterium]
MDISLHYVEAGEGFPLILLHGNGEDSGYFQHQMAFFASKYRVIAVDTRGHGKSPRGEVPFTLTRFVEDLHDFMTEHRIEKAHLLGFSDGGNIALLFALKYPSFVERLILNGANLEPSGVKGWVQIPVVLGYYFASLFKKRSEKAKAKAELLGLMVCEPHISESSLKELSMPVLVIAGTKDMIKDRHTRRIAAAIGGAKLEILEGDHFIASKCPAAFNSAVDVFLAEEMK